MPKGEGSLITVILLIGFTILLGITIYLFTQKITAEQIDDVTQDEGCTDISIKILEACYDTQIKIKVESKTSLPIDKGFLIKVKGEKTSIVPSLPPFAVLEGLNIEEISTPYMSDMGAITEVEVIPKIRKNDGSQIICPLKAEKHSIIACF